MLEYKETTLAAIVEKAMYIYSNFDSQGVSSLAEAEHIALKHERDLAREEGKMFRLVIQQEGSLMPYRGRPLRSLLELPDEVVIRSATTEMIVKSRMNNLHVGDIRPIQG